MPTTVWALLVLGEAFRLYLEQEFWSASVTDRVISAAVFVAWTGLLITAETIVPDSARQRHAEQQRPSQQAPA